MNDNAILHKETLADLKDKVSDVTDIATHIAKNALADLKDKVSHATENANEKAQNLVATMGEKTDDALHRVGEQLASAGANFGDNIPSGGALAKPLGAVAAQVQSGGEYLAHHGMGDIAADLTSLIRKYPAPALGIGLCIGILLGSALSRR